MGEQARRRLSEPDDHLFLSVRGQPLAHSTVYDTFQQLLHVARIAPERSRPPRIHDLRHSFATRVLEQCGAERRAIARHSVALATYLGHSNIAHTYWYLEATPELMTDLAQAAELLVTGIAP